MKLIGFFITLFFIAVPAYSASEKDCFDNEKLLQIEQKSAQEAQNTVIYIWSDRMSYSVQQLIELDVSAKAQGWQFIAVPEQEFCSDKLKNLNALLHFPMSFVVSKENGLHHLPIIGAMPRGYWRRLVQQRLANPYLRPGF